MTTVLMLFSLLAASVVSSLVPAVNAEALVVASVLAAPPALTLLIVVVVTAGQVLGKVVLYRGGLGITRVSTAKKSRRARGLVERLRARPGELRLMLLASASVGLPPLYLMAVVAGAAGLPLGSFAVLCVVGRFARFYALALVPALL
jgi:membrane protein YqaA with SNARE-associated domain